MPRRILIIDMTTTTADAPPPRSPNRALVWLERFLLFVTVVFGLGTVLALGTLPASLNDAGMGVHATVVGPYSVTSPSGPAFTQQNHHEVDNDRRRLDNGEVEDSSLHVTLRVAPNDRDSRVAMSVGLLAAIALGWVGLVAVRRLVHSARMGDPFNRRNVARLRCLAAVVVAIPAVGWVLNLVLEHTRDWTREFNVDVANIGVAPVLIAALAIVALAEIFREGANLRELEQSTI
jgi:hypothetical protein